MYKFLIWESDVFGEFLKEVFQYKEDALIQCHLKDICVGVAEDSAEGLVG